MTVRLLKDGVEYANGFVPPEKLKGMYDDPLSAIARKPFDVVMMNRDDQ